MFHAYFVQSLSPAAYAIQHRSSQLVSNQYPQAFGGMEISTGSAVSRNV